MHSVNRRVFTKAFPDKKHLFIPCYLKIFALALCAIEAHYTLKKQIKPRKTWLVFLSSVHNMRSRDLLRVLTLSPLNFIDSKEFLHVNSVTVKAHSNNPREKGATLDCHATSRLFTKGNEWISV